MDDSPTRRIPQQARSRKRWDAILNAAERLLAKEGYDNVTTNAIAAEAGVSIGSLYQYFGNKEGIVRTIAERYLERMAGLHREVLADDALAEMPLPLMLDRMIDPFVAFHLQNPAFGQLMLGSDVSDELAAATADMDEAVIERIRQMITLRVPGISPGRATLMARTCKAMVKALFALLEGNPDDREALVGEVKRLFTLYLEDAGGG
jgi:AcrR family transcriptional regulator